MLILSPTSDEARFYLEWIFGMMYPIKSQEIWDPRPTYSADN